MSFRWETVSVMDPVETVCATLFRLIKGFAPPAPIVLRTASTKGHHVPRPKKPLNMAPRRMH